MESELILSFKRRGLLSKRGEEVEEAAEATRTVQQLMSFVV